MRITIAGAGAVGARAARQLLALETTPAASRVRLVDPDTRRVTAVARSLGPSVSVARDLDDAMADGADVLLLACPGPQRRYAEKGLDAGAHVVSTTDDPRSATALLDLDAEATERGRTVAVGAGFMPGLTDVLARHAAADFTAVDEIHVAKSGTGGAACARQHHWALAAPMREWRDGAWVERSSGSGRELCWFPDPVGGLDCYRAALADPSLLHNAFPGALRVTARVAATRRDRITAHLPMLRRPHAEGKLGAVRVEVRGWRGAVSDTRVLGVIDRPAVAAGCVAAVTSLWIAEGRLNRPGAMGLGGLVTDPVPFLAELRGRGVRAAVFEGADAG